MRLVQMQNGLPVSIDVSVGTAYSESIYYSSGLAANTAITLPNSQTFSSASAKDLLVVINDRIVECDREFQVFGAGPAYSQIKILFDLTNDTIVRFIQNV